ncbi:MAG: HsdR family type I site-specific deoxyribonuclease [Candidatus Bipolaricaulota bacterium]|nr:HsdR family type I site-specific deoxyribonuclease [Candidatus Bipolaricaulota bacterium]MDW8126920.1 HsdR family type I site-specific deoxyribonuclease [Candidatus Bipolaricaulota bacterium]
MAVLGSERNAVQMPFIRYAQEVGWRYLPPEEAERLRRGESGLLLHDVFVQKVQELNPGVVDLPRAEELARRLSHVRPSVEGNLEVWEYLKGLKTVFVPEEKRELNVKLLDPQRPENNAFHVTDELAVRSGHNRAVLDIAFFVNGIPVLVVEAKAAHRLDGISIALEQVQRYHREVPEFFTLAQLYALTHLVQFYYSATWRLSPKDLFNWREEQTGDFETLVKSFVAPSRILRVLTEYILFVRRDGELSKVVLRPRQMRAVERVLGRARDPKKHRGLVWHTQGSGKTYTMITVARRLIEDPFFRNPTVLMIVDRNELQQQLFQNLQSVGFGHVEVAQSKRHLQELLARDTRGLIVSMIHKFDDMPPNINTRENIFVLVDEAHRSTGAELGTYLMAALPNATFIGFTGTPIDKTASGRGTFKTFGTDDPQGYLDKYSIRESIEDGTTVPLHYQLAPNELIADRDAMEREFWALAELEGITDIEELNRVLDKAVNLKNMLKSPERVRKVAEFIAKHFKEYVDPSGYKAFVVAVDREACALYKQELDRHLPPEWSQVVISRGPNDPPELVRYHLSEEKEEEGRRKTAGLIVDFVGIFDRLEQALAFDSEAVTGVIEGIEVLQERFRKLMEKASSYLTLEQGKPGDKAVETVLEFFRDQEERERFYQFFREVESLYEILSPDPFLRPYLPDYQKLVRIYHLVREAFEPHDITDRGFLRKTAEIVRKLTRTPGIMELGPVYALNGAALEKLAHQEVSETVRVFNLIKAFFQLVNKRKQNEPYLIPIGERAERIAQAFYARQLSSQEALRELTKLVDEVKTAEEERKASDLSPEGFAVYWSLKREGVEPAHRIAQRVEEALKALPHWDWDPAQEREFRKELYKVLLEAGCVDGVRGMVEGILRILRRQR